MDYLKDFPAHHGQAREDLIISLLESPRRELDFKRIDYVYGPYETKLWVTADALKIDGIRVNVTAKTQQIIANKFGALLPTAKISDLIWQHADININPCPFKINSTTKGMIDHSLKVDSQLKGKDVKGKIISTVGKDWVIDNSLIQNARFGSSQAINYGWHFPGNSFQGMRGGVTASLIKDSSGIFVRMIQTLGGHHDNNHVDYSQVCRLVARECEINGKMKDLAEVLQNEEYAKIFNHNGVLTTVFQPGAPNPGYNFVPSEPVIIKGS